MPIKSISLVAVGLLIGVVATFVVLSRWHGETLSYSLQHSLDVQVASQDRLIERLDQSRASLVKAGVDASCAASLVSADTAIRYDGADAITRALPQGVQALPHQQAIRANLADAASAWASYLRENRAATGSTRMDPFLTREMSNVLPRGTRAITVAPMLVSRNGWNIVSMQLAGEKLHLGDDTTTTEAFLKASPMLNRDSQLTPSCSVA